MNADADLAYLRVASLVFDTPLLLAKTQGLLAGEYLAARMLGREPASPESNRFRGEEQKDEISKEWKGYARIGSVARIGLMGKLVNRGAWMGSYSGMTSYEGFTEQLARAENDPEITSIILDVDSPGGQASGMIEAARRVRQAAQRKPVIAIVNALAASAAYGLISGASEIVAAESAELGSIGVLMVHLDRSAQLAEQGVKATIVHAGARKVDGNPFTPLEGDALKSIQSRVDEIMGQFTTLIAEHRGLKTQSIVDLEGGILSARKAVEIGLADRLGTIDTVLSDLSRAEDRRTNSPPRRTTMSNSEGAIAATQNGFTQADLDQATEKARAEGKQAAHTRIEAITSDEKISASGARMKAALELATKSPDMSAADVVSFVASNVGQEAEAAPASEASLDARQDKPDSLAILGKTESPEAASAQWSKAIDQVNSAH